MMVISDYDRFDYDYSQYWKERSYENRAEFLALGSLLKNVSGNFFLDIGGSYGRLSPLYYNKFKNPIIVDYSLKTLQKNSVVLRKDFPNLTLIAANIYFPPFKENSFDGAMMVRVLHHIEKPQDYLEKLSVIMKGGSTYIQEFANKVHMKAAVKAILKGNLAFFSQETYQQPTQGSFEGSNGEESVFLNFHPKALLKLLEKNGFALKRTKGISFLRIPLLKKLLPEGLLIFFESVAQKLFSWTNISPSIAYKLESRKEKSVSTAKELNEILCCPKCRGDLKIEEDSATCKSCNEEYRKKDGIWDFRTN